MTNIEFTEKIREILIKKAEGYDYTEETYEYQKPTDSAKQLSFDDIFDPSTENNQLKKRKTVKSKQIDSDADLVLIKKKVTTHHIPPDMLAVKILLENFNSNKNSYDDLEKLSDDELITLKNNILKSLNNIEKEVDDES